MRIMMIISLVILTPTLSVVAQEEPVPAVEVLSVLSDTSSDIIDDGKLSESSVANESGKPVQQEVLSESEVTKDIPSFTKATQDKPEVEEEVFVPEVVEPEEELVGIDTVSLEDPQGNWLFKRIWWERAEDRYGKIRDLVNSIWESRTTFFMQRNDLDKKVLDPFYLSLGMGQGELQVILSELDEFFQKEREKDGDLNEQERTLYTALEEEQESLRQLKTDVESISNLDQAVDDALSTLMDQINKARQLEKQAWENFKEIAHVLSDVKAREVYYMMDGAGKNIKNISLYLEKDFTNHFARLISEAKKHTTRVLDQIKSLKEKGVDFKRQVDRLAQQEEQDRQAQTAQEEQDDEDMIKAKPKKQGWVDWAISLPGVILDYIVSIVRIPYDMIFGGKK